MATTTADATGVTVRPLTAHIGAEIDGVDLSQDISDATFRTILDAFHKHGVIVFHGQSLTPERHIAFSRRFGELEVHVLSQYNLPGHPEIFVLSNVKEGGRAVGADRGGRFWHSDLSYVERPSLGSLLYGVECPPEGGDTLFASMYAAYDALPEDRKAELTRMRGVHDFAYHYATYLTHRPPLTDEQRARVPPVEHPAVRTHPVTGRKALYVGEGLTSHFAGMDMGEGRRLVKELSDFATQPEFVYRHKWKAGDLVFWDNRCTMHQATEFDEEKYRRVMYRTTVAGDKPF